MQELPTSEVGLKRLAEDHVGPAVRRLGELINDSDPRVAFDASQLVLKIARPHALGVWDQRRPELVWPGDVTPVDPWDGDQWGGGFRAG